jgi:hypothetical protein
MAQVRRLPRGPRPDPPLGSPARFNLRSKDEYRFRPQVPRYGADYNAGSPLLTHCRVIGPGISSMGVRPSFFRGHHTTTQLTLSSQVSVSDRLCTCQTAEPRPHI